LTWIKEDKYRTIKVVNENAQGKKWFAHCLLVPVSEFDKLKFVDNFLVSMDIVESVLSE
jgi:hypothetical protein